ncbi:peptidyl-prolyl cis-trans isomerase [Pseudoalteromonas sp. T1lg75]|uniref:peptidylprolyl isomerase n=1 Tax=Pseudoalteromonas sp. T1lg75 TaxID=2077102 RepID=UPI000CF67A1E|nr:peptidylprolyl isomerase [Pseudoalteromonas sp. T1lg75]
MRLRAIILIGLFGLSSWAYAQLPTPQEVSFMRTLYQQQSLELAAQSRERLIENAFLLVQAQHTFPHLLLRQAEVGFDNQYHVRRYLLNAWQVHAWLDPSTLPALPQTPFWTAQWLSQTLGSYPSDGRLSTDRLAQLNSVELLPENGPWPALNLGDFYQSMSMQIKFRLHRADLDVFIAELTRWHKYREASKQLAAKLKQQQLTLSRLEEMALADILRPSILGQLGVQQTLHGQSPELERLKGEISDTQIARYYERHQQSFRYIERVSAQGVRFKDAQAAHAFYEQAMKVGFAAALATHEDIFTQHQGELSRDDKAKGFAYQLAFTLPAQTISRPVRTPKGRWLVIHCQDKEYGLYPAQSQTVRYQAMNAIAKEQAQANYRRQYLAWRKDLGLQE